MNEGTNPQTTPAPQPAQQSSPSTPPDQLRELLDWLDGKKTHLCVAAAIIYTIGSDIGWWPFNQQIVQLMGLGALSALRARIAKK